MQSSGARATTAVFPEPAGLLSTSFLGLLATQFLGAVNDNMFRWLVVPIAKALVPEESKAIALSAGLACFVLPFVVLAAPAGYVADRFSKRSVIVTCKVIDVFLVMLGVGAIWFGNIRVLFLIELLIGCQAAMFGPSKYGSIPELVHPSRISAANGLVGLTTVLAVVTGAVAGNYLYSLTGHYGRDNLWISASVLLSIAVLGLLVSLPIVKLRPGDPTRTFPFNMVGQTYHDIRQLTSNRALFRVAAGSSFFWGLASLAQMNIDLFGTMELKLEQQNVGPLVGILSVGVGVGSVLAGIWSAGKVELGIVPLAAIGIATSAMLLFTVPVPVLDHAWGPYLWTCLWLFMLGTSSGMYEVPLASFIQHRSPVDSRGSILAASNFITYSGMFGVSFLFWMMQTQWGMSARQIFLCAGLMTLPVAAYAFILLPQATMRFIVWSATHTIYRVRIEGQDNLAVDGGAVLVANHISWIDGALLLTISSRPVRMLVKAPYADLWLFRGLARMLGVIPLKPDPQSIQPALDAAREAVKNGELVCIFPEGAISRSGQLQTFQPGLMSIVEGTTAPIIPIYLDQLWGSIFSFKGGKFFWKLPEHWRFPVRITIGAPLVEATDIHHVRQTVEQLGVDAVNKRISESKVLPRVFLRRCRSALFREKISDSTGVSLTGGVVLMRSLIVRRLLLREVLSPEERFVGVLLPPSVAGVLANSSVTLAGRAAVNLNYTVSSEIVDYCLKQCGIRHVITSRKFLEKIDLRLDAELVYLEDLRDKVTAVDKLHSAFQAYSVPSFVLERRLGLTKIKHDDLFTVIFTSGSTGQPKGVMLTYGNVGSNTLAIEHVIHLNKHDVLLGILPFFHSFGFTVTLWSVLGLNIKGAYHFNPLEARQVGKLCRERKVTIMLSTPTFLRSYLRRCEPEELASVEVVVAGAEKLPKDLGDAFEEKFHVRPVEGYGTTELSPLVSVNIPPSRALGDDEGLREGSVGRPVPGVAARIVHPETDAELGANEPGMLLIKGPNVMQGYLGQPELTAKVLRDGWYVTGDIAFVDSDGFIHITGRLSRFSKIGGEMVPHLKIEEHLQRIMATESDEQKLSVAVTAVPDERKGERIVVLHTASTKSAAEACKELQALGLPNLWIPSPDSFVEVAEIPVLGTGKLDLQGMKQLALEKLGPSTAKSS